MLENRSNESDRSDGEGTVARSRDGYRRQTERVLRQFGMTKRGRFSLLGVEHDHEGFFVGFVIHAEAGNQFAIRGEPGFFPAGGLDFVPGLPEGFRGEDLVDVVLTNVGDSGAAFVFLAAITDKDFHGGIASVKIDADGIAVVLEEHLAAHVFGRAVAPAQLAEIIANVREGEGGAGQEEGGDRHFFAGGEGDH